MSMDDSKVMLMKQSHATLFGFALLRNMIGVELKLTPYFTSARLKTKSFRDLGHLRFLTLRADNLLLLLLLIILL